MRQKKERTEKIKKTTFFNKTLLNNEYLILTVIILVAFFIRQSMHVRLFPDSIYYLTFAKNVINGIHNSGGNSLARFKWSPLYPHFVALFSFGNSTPGYLVEIARQISIFAGSFLIIPVYFLSRNMFNTASAILAAVLIAVTPEFIYFSGAVLTESTATLFTGISFLLIWRANLVSSGKLRLLIYSLLGISLGMSFLARHATIGFLPIAIVWLSIIGFRENKSDVTAAKLKKTGVSILIVIVSFFATLSPQIFYLHSETGKWAIAVDPTSGFARKLEAAGKDLRYTQSYEAWHSLSPDSSKYIWEAEENPGLLSTTISNPGNFIKGYIKTLFGGYLADTNPLPYPKIILASLFAGILFLIFKQKFRQLIFLAWGFGGYYAFLALFQNMRDRYMYPVFPLLVIISSAGALWITREAIKFIKKISERELMEKLSLCITIIIFIIVILPTSLSLIKIQNRMSKTSFLFRLGEQIAPKIEEGAVIFDRNPHLTFFSGGVPAIVPYAEIDQVIKFGQITGVKYWIIESGYVPRLRPQFSLLLNPSMAPDALRPVAGLSNDNYRIIVYEILPE